MRRTVVSITVLAAIACAAPAFAGPRALEVRPTAVAPVRDGTPFDWSSISAESAIIVDVASHRVLLSKNAHEQRPVASITKLITAIVALRRGVSFSQWMRIAASDEVGGARLRVRVGTRFSVRDLFYAMLVASANNAANAVSRATGMGKTAFVSSMNAQARRMGLSETSFVDPTGIEPANVSSARDVAALALEAFALQPVRSATTSASYLVGTNHPIKNTDALLIDETNGLYVLGGKTGYLPESQWNFVVKMMDEHRKPLVIAVMGSSTMGQSFNDAETLARWAWAHFSWTP